MQKESDNHSDDIEFKLTWHQILLISGAVFEILFCVAMLKWRNY